MRSEGKCLSRAVHISKPKGKSSKRSKAQSALSRREGQKKKVEIPIEQQLRLMRLKKRKGRKKNRDEAETSVDALNVKNSERRASTGNLTEAWQEFVPFA